MHVRSGGGELHGRDKQSCTSSRLKLQSCSRKTNSLQCASSIPVKVMSMTSQWLSNKRAVEGHVVSVNREIAH